MSAGSSERVRRGGRQIVEGEGQRVAWLRQTGALTPTWRGVDSCSVTGPTRVYVGIDGFLAPMVTEAEKQKRRAARVRRRRRGRPGARLRNYVGERTSMIRYAENRARGWDIGSGPTESLCNTMVRRLKGAGMRWDPAGADAILQLTALQNSNAWENYWKLTAQQN